MIYLAQNKHFERKKKHVLLLRLLITYRKKIEMILKCVNHYYLHEVVSNEFVFMYDVSIIFV